MKPIGIVLVGLLIVVIVLSSTRQQVPAHAITVTAVAVLASPSSSPASLDYRALARQDALAVGLSPDIFERQINEESGFNPRAVSPAGAIGIAQFMPATARALGVNPWDPVASLKAAAHLMASYLHRYQGNYAMALAAYNVGSGAVAYAVAHGGSQWEAYLPLETRTYITVILGGGA
jgi:soluble lytic murein transglycosylase-like protein